MFRHSLTARAAFASLLAVLTTFGLVGSAGAIVEGDLADPGEYPWMVALTGPDGGQFCGGSIIAPDLVLTAAHCLEGETVESVRAQAGTNTIGTGEGQIRTAVTIRLHSNPEINDIAIIKVDRPFDFNPSVQQIALADAQAQADLLDNGSPSVVTGWGALAEDDEGGSTELREAELTLLGDAECAAVAATVEPDPDSPEDEEQGVGEGGAPEVEICASSSAGRDSCYGDSGGPLVVQDPATFTWYQAGVVSYGLAECGNAAGVYAEVAAFAEFVQSEGQTDGIDLADVPDEESDDVESGDDADPSADEEQPDEEPAGDDHETDDGYEDCPWWLDEDDMIEHNLEEQWESEAAAWEDEWEEDWDEQWEDDWAW